MTPATPPQADATPKVQLRRGAKTKTKAKPTGKTQARGKAKAPPGDKVKAKRQRAAKPKQQAKRTRKQATARHTRAIQRDRSKRPLVAPPPAQMQERLKELIHPATLAQVAHFHGLGLRQRLLTLPVMVAVVLSLLWRQIGGVHDLTRTLKREGFLWCSPVQVSPQALSERLRTLPAGLFLRILEAILPAMQARFAARTRPLPPVVAWARERYAAVLVADGSTLDALLRKVGLLQDAATHPLAGRMLALLDLASQLPRQIWYDPNPKGHDLRFWPQLKAALPPGALLLFDRGFTDFARFLELTRAQVTWITAAKANLCFEVAQRLVRSEQLADCVVWIGSGESRQQVRRVQVLVKGKWLAYLTNELDPKQLPGAELVGLYRHRWRIEEAYATVKRLLGLAYFWVGSENGVQLQVWATWLLYAVLIDLTDAVAEQLQQPLAAVSVEMVYRSVYHFVQAFQRELASDLVVYLASEAKDLGVLKAKRRRKPPADGWPALTLPALA